MPLSLAITGAAMAALLDVMIAPLLVAAYATAWGLGDQGAGYVLGIEFLGVFLAGLFLAPRIDAIDRRAAAVAALVVVVVADLLVLAIGGVVALVTLRFVTGLAAGVALCAANASLAAHPRPLVASAVMGGGVVAIGFVIFAAWPALSALGPATGIVGATAAVSAIGAGLALGLPRRPAAGSAAARASWTRHGLALLAASGLFLAAGNIGWAFSERLGHRLALSDAQVAAALSMGAVGSLIGPLLAALSFRARRMAALIGAILALVAGAAAFVLAFDGGSYLAAVFLLALSTAFGCVLFNATLAEEDASGRLAAAGAPVTALANVVGGPLGAVAIAAAGMRGAAIATFALLAACAILLLGSAWRRPAVARA